MPTWAYVVFFTVLIFSYMAFNIYLTKTLEAFDTQTSTVNSLADKAKQVSDLLTPITNILCPIQQGVQKVIAQTNVNANNQPDANGKVIEIPATQQDISGAFNEMLFQAKGNLFACPAPTDMTLLPATFSDEISLSFAYLYTKITTINQTVQQALSGQLAETNDDDNDKPGSSLDTILHALRTKAYSATLDQYNAEQEAMTTPATLTDTETDALLTDRLTKLNQLLAKKDPLGFNLVNTSLTSLQQEYTQLKKTSNKAKNGELMPNVSAFPTTT